MKSAVFPGTFDPVTLGHVDLVERALTIFDQVIVAILINPAKRAMLPTELREELLRKTFASFGSRIEVCRWQGLLVQLCKERSINHVIRGLRTVGDFDFEIKMCLANKKLESTIETVFLLTSEKLSSVSSSVVRELLIFGGDFSEFVPDTIVEDLKNFRAKYCSVNS